MNKCRPLEIREIARLLEVCRADKSWLGERDALTILLLTLRGLRAGEPGVIKRAWFLRPRMGKDGKPKREFTIARKDTKKEHGNCRVVLPEPVWDLAVKVASHRVRKGRRGGESPALIRGRTGRALGRKGVWKRIKVRCNEAGVDPWKVGAHSFRHKYGRMLKTREAEAVALELFHRHMSGDDLAQYGLRHSNARTTKVYLDKPTEAEAGEVGVVLMARKLGYG